MPYVFCPFVHKKVDAFMRIYMDQFGKLPDVKMRTEQVLAFPSSLYPQLCVFS